MRVSVIFTVLNEALTLPGLLDSLASQTRPPDEVVVCDGGSHDDTLRLLRIEQRFKLHVIVAAGANISRGRNIAITAASHEIIACTDAGVRLHPQWLEQLVAPFAVTDYGITNPQSHIVHWVAGFFHPDTHAGRAFDIAMSATVLPALQDVNPSKFLPSSRSVAFLRSAWASVGGYPEWLDYCEDIVFDLSMQARFGGCAFARDALVYFRPRSSLRSFFKQYYLYARGDGKANLWVKRHAVRYATYLLLLPVLCAGIVAIPDLWIRLISAIVMVAGFVFYTRAPYRRLATLWQGLSVIAKIRAMLLVPVIRVVGDIAKMVGYPVGVAWRVHKHRSLDK